MHAGVNDFTHYVKTILLSGQSVSTAKKVFTTIARQQATGDFLVHIGVGSRRTIHFCCAGLSYFSRDDNLIPCCLCFAPVSCHGAIFWVQSVKVGDMDYPLGQDQGVQPHSSISPETFQRILDGVERGNPENIYFYGLLKLYGISMIKDVPGAAQQFHRASGLGHKEATTAYGVMQLSGDLGIVDEAQASEYFRKAIALGDMNAHWLLGMTLLRRQAFSEAAVYLHRAVASHVPQAYHLLGLMHEYGQGGLTQSFEEARELYKQGVELHQPESMYHLGLLELSGRASGGEANGMKARSLFEYAAKSFHHAPSWYYLGICRTYGYGGPVDYENALRAFEMAGALDDRRVVQQAQSAAQELKRLLEEAYKVNHDTLEQYRRQVMEH